MWSQTNLTSSQKHLKSSCCNILSCVTFSKMCLWDIKYSGLLCLETYSHLVLYPNTDILLDIKQTKLGEVCNVVLNKYIYIYIIFPNTKILIWEIMKSVLKRRRRRCGRRSNRRIPQRIQAMAPRLIQSIGKTFFYPFSIILT